jgi:hypothetical protein
MRQPALLDGTVVLDGKTVLDGTTVADAEVALGDPGALERPVVGLPLGAGENEVWLVLPELRSGK